MMLMEIQFLKADLNMALSIFNSYMPRQGLLLYALCIQSSHTAASFMKG